MSVLVRYRVALVLCAVGLLANACGGGGAPLAPPPTPTLFLEVRAGGTLRFTWADVARETGYRLYEDPDGVSGYSEVGSTGKDGTSYILVVSLPDRMDARYVLDACNTDGCSRSRPVFLADALGETMLYVKAMYPEMEDQFGWSIALSSDGATLVVGAPGDDSGARGPKHPGDADYVSSQADDSASGAGAVYVFTRSGEDWIQQAYLKAWNADAADGFGTSVALAHDGHTLAVGAPREDGNGVGGEVDNSTGESGAAYIFTRSGTTWFSEYYIKATNPDSGDQLGRAIALSGDGTTLAAAALYEDSGETADPASNSIEDSGAVYVFLRDLSTWYQQAYLKAPVIDADDRFGWSLALSTNGDVLAVGYPYEDGSGTSPMDNLAPGSGAVAVFQRSGASWDERQYIKPGVVHPYDEFGSSVSLSGDGAVLAVGAPGESSDGTDPDDTSAHESGAVTLFQGGGGPWAQVAYVKATFVDSAGTFGDRFGSAVAFSPDGLTLAVGAVGESSSTRTIDGDASDNSAPQSGAAYLLSASTGIFRHTTYLKAPNSASSDLFGTRVAVTNGAARVAVSATGEDGGSGGIGGDLSDDSAPRSGAVYVR